MGALNYSGGRSKNDTSFNSSITEITYQDMKGLSSSPRGLTDPDKFYSLVNFIKNEYGFWESRSGYTHRAHIPMAIKEPDSFTEFLPNNSTQSKLVLISNGYVYAYTEEDGLETLSYAGSADFLDTSLDLCKCCSYLNNVYIVDGTQHIYKYDGTTITRLTFPHSADYGNPITIDEFVGRLWVGTNQSYMCYTTFNSDTVWEERILMVGTGAASGTTLTGTNTIFTSAQINVGDKLLLVEGGVEEYVYVSTVTNNTSISLSSTVTNTFNSANIFYIGNRFADKVGSGDGLSIKDIQPFGNNLAIAKTSDAVNSKLGKLYVLQPSIAVDPTTGLPIGSTLLNRIDSQENYTNIHPYSMEEYKGFLVYVADKKIKALTKSSSTDGLVLEPTDLSDGKLESILENSTNEFKNKTKIVSINNPKTNSLMISLQIGDHVDTIISGVFEKEEMLFSVLSIPTYISGTYVNTTLTGGYLCNYRSYALVMSKLALGSIFDTDTYIDRVLNLSSWTMDSTTPETFDDTSPPTGDTSFTTNYAIYKHFETGVTKNESWNRFAINKHNLISSEAAADLDFSNTNTYSVSLILDNTYTSAPITRIYTGANKELYTFDSTSDWTFDSTTLPTFDITNLNYSDTLRISWFSFVKSCRSVATSFTDTLTTGSIRIAGYGYTIRINKYD